MALAHTFHADGAIPNKIQTCQEAATSRARLAISLPGISGQELLVGRPRPLTSEPTLAEGPQLGGLLVARAVDVRRVQPMSDLVELEKEMGKIDKFLGKRG